LILVGTAKRSGLPFLHHYFCQLLLIKILITNCKLQIDIHHFQKQYDISTMPEQSAQSPAAYLAAYEEEEEQDRDISTTNSATGTSGTSIEEHSVNIEKSAKRTYFVAILVVMLGAAASSAFLYLGITNSKSDEEELFERRAVDLAKEIDSAWRDYEVAALWIHESCRNWREENYTHDDFRVLYDYIKSSGLDFGKS